MTSAEIRAVARQDLGGKLFGEKWLMALVLAFIYGAVIGLASSIAGVGELIVIGPMTVGYYAVLLNFSRHGASIDIGRMFEEGFSKDFGRTLLIGLLKCIFLTLWTMLFVIPGCVKYYSYALAEYIAVDNPQYTWKECITESRRLMDGNKMRLFILDLSFIGWIIVGIITCGIGMLWVSPYMMQARTIFYRSIVDGTTEYSDDSDSVNSGTRKLPEGSSGEVPDVGYILCVEGEISGARIPLVSGDSVIIGRDPDVANVVLAGDMAVSRKHCQVIYNAGSFIITDYSKNGITLEDGTTLQNNVPVNLYPGNIFRLSKTTAFMVQ